MARACTICNLAQRSRLEQMVSQGASNRYVARVFGVTEQAIRRHKATHGLQAVIPKNTAVIADDSASDQIGPAKALDKIVQPSGAVLQSTTKRVRPVSLNVIKPVPLHKTSHTEDSEPQAEMVGSSRAHE